MVDQTIAEWKFDLLSHGEQAELIYKYNAVWKISSAKLRKKYKLDSHDFANLMLFGFMSQKAPGPSIPKPKHKQTNYTSVGILNALRNYQTQLTPEVKEQDQTPEDNVALKPHIIVHKDKILVSMPFNIPAKTELKERVPYEQRSWNPEVKSWVLTMSKKNFDIANEVLDSHFKNHVVFNKTGDQQITWDVAIDRTSYYTLLKVSESATQEEIKRAYRKLVMKLHPDRAGEDLDRRYFHDVQTAYETLKNKKRRKKYDLARSLLYEKGQSVPNRRKPPRSAPSSRSAPAYNATLRQVFTNAYKLGDKVFKLTDRRIGRLSVTMQIYKVRIEFPTIDEVTGYSAFYQVYKQANTDLKYMHYVGIGDPVLFFSRKRGRVTAAYIKTIAENAFWIEDGYNKYLQPIDRLYFPSERVKLTDHVGMMGSYQGTLTDIDPINQTFTLGNQHFSGQLNSITGIERLS